METSSTASVLVRSAPTALARLTSASRSRAYRPARRAPAAPWQGVQYVSYQLARTCTTRRVGRDGVIASSHPVWCGSMQARQCRQAFFPTRRPQPQRASTACGRDALGRRPSRTPPRAQGHRRLSDRTFHMEWDRDLAPWCHIDRGRRSEPLGERRPVLMKSGSSSVAWQIVSKSKGPPAEERNHASTGEEPLATCVRHAGVGRIVHGAFEHDEHQPLDRLEPRHRKVRPPALEEFRLARPRRASLPFLPSEDPRLPCRKRPRLVPPSSSRSSRANQRRE